MLKIIDKIMIFLHLITCKLKMVALPMPIKLPSETFDSKSSPRDFFAKTAIIIACVLLCVSMLCIVIVMWKVIFPNIEIKPRVDTEGYFEWVMFNYSPSIFGLGASIIIAVVAIVLLWSTKLFITEIIPEKDREMLVDALSKGNKESVYLYIHLSSLRGFTGTFTQLGISGLPLATVSMTVFFCSLSLVVGDGSGNENRELMDLAKLTLGAFIGSFKKLNPQK